jgi:hypothetical protein
VADDIDKVVAYAQSQGWTIKVTANGYRHFYDPEGNWIVHYPKTPGRPQRRLADVLTAIKRAGLEWPPPRRKK